MFLFGLLSHCQFNLFSQQPSYTIAENVIKYYILVINYNARDITYCMEVVVRGCRALGSIIPGPDYGRDKFQWFCRGFKPRMEKEEFIGDHTVGLV